MFIIFVYFRHKMDDILYEDEAFNGVTVKAATVDKLVRHCLKQFGKFKLCQGLGRNVLLFVLLIFLEF